MTGGKGYSKRLGDTLWLHYEGRTYTINLNDATATATDTATGTSTGPAARAKSQQQHSGVLKSPMPGKVLKVNFKSGDKITSGQTVCVIEAMKMEYALKAPFTGTIKQILKKPGDPVSLDEKIAQIEEVEK